MTRTFDRFITLCVGVAIGVTIMWAFGKLNNESQNVKVSLEPEISADAALEVVATTAIRANPNTGETQPTQAEISSTYSVVEVEPQSIVSPISLPQVYEDRIGPRQRIVSIPDIHEIFKNEPRDEPWADAMESGINHYLANSDSGDWAVVEYIECRSRICELAGYTIESENDPQKLIEEFLGSNIWHGEPGLHMTRFGNRKLKRFIIIISDYSDEELRSALSSL